MSFPHSLEGSSFHRDVLTWLFFGNAKCWNFERKKDPEESEDDRLLLEEIERALSDELTVEEILGLGVKLDKLETQMVSQNGRFELTKPLRKRTRWWRCWHRENTAWWR